MTELTLAIDQSTQGTKILLVKPNGTIAYKTTAGHKQIISSNGWISHDLTEITKNLKTLLCMALKHTGGNKITAVAISNQRETAAAWSRTTAQPLALAVVWQDNRAVKITNNPIKQSDALKIKEKTGLPLSPYFSAAKFEWLQTHEPSVSNALDTGDLCLGTIDSWLLYILSDGVYKTEPSNACRTQLMNIETGNWDLELCQLFGINPSNLPTIVDSDSLFGTTDLFGMLATPVPIISMLGDSQAALFAENCLDIGQTKVTFGTGSSVMLNTGEKLIRSNKGLNTSVAWRKKGRTIYALEGNINYSGALVTWLKDNLNIISDPSETDAMAQAAHPNDTTLFIPAFSGMATPYNHPDLRTALIGMSPLTGKNEIVRAGLDAVVYQINDIISLMKQYFPEIEPIVHADGGMIANYYLMQRLADITQRSVYVSTIQELSGVGAALNGKNSQGLTLSPGKIHSPKMDPDTVVKQVSIWKKGIYQLTK